MSSGQDQAKLGRPTKYKEEYCQMLIEHMSSGLSFESFAAVIDVNRDTLYEWAKVHSDFSDTKKRAFDKCLLWWEKAGIAGLWGTKDSQFNTGVFVFSMKNRFKWTDKVEVTGGDENTKPIMLSYKVEK